MSNEQLAISNGRKMKPSGVEWIGEIPQEWDTIKVKYTSWLKGRIGWDGLKSTEYVDEGPYLITGTDFDKGVINWDSCVHITEERFNEDELLHILEGDLLITKDGTVGKVAIAKNCPDKVSLNSGVLLIRNDRDFKYHDKFIYFVLISDEFWRWYTLSQTGQSTIKHLYQEQFYNFEFGYPPLDEQARIADFLDRRCAEIDSVIAETKKTIEEYKALKQSIITEAVTKGIRGPRPMKPSGIEYCDAIPSSWNVTRMAFANWIRARLGWKGLKADEYVDIGYPFLSAFNIINDKLVWCDLNHITQERYDESPEIKLSVGDILLVKDGAGIGKCGRIDELPLGEATVNSSLAVITPNEHLHYKYEYYYFLCDAFQKVITVLRNGMGVPHLTQEIMKSIKVPMPPMEEQVEIATYLDKKGAEVDLLIATKQRLLTELETYKKSVIYEYVTGKKEVTE